MVRRNITLLFLSLFLVLGNSPVWAVVNNKASNNWFDLAFKKLDYVPGQIIIKFKPIAKRTESLRNLYKQFKVKAMEQIIKSTPKPEDIVTQLNNKIEQLKTNKASQQELENLDKQINEQIKLKENLAKRQLRAIGDRQLPSLENIYLLTVDKKANILNLVDKFSKDPSVEYAGPNYIFKAQVEPNDPYYKSYGSWGQSFYDMWGLKKLVMNKAWDISEGQYPNSKSVLVAVVDSGVDYTHPDIKDNIWVNNAEIPNNGKDDDGNGYIDDYYGYNFANNNSDPKDGDGHGTHVAGTIAGVGNNNKGVVGVAYKAKIMAVKGLDDTGSGTSQDLARGIVYAVDNGAEVINNSWGGGYSQLVEDVLAYAYSKGCVVVAAAGNEDACANKIGPSGSRNVITVAATDHLDKRCSFSNWGYKVDVAACGSDVLSTMSDDSHIAKNNPDWKVGNGYYRLDGTSMASPHVAGLAALILAKFEEASNISVKGRIIATADPLTNQPDNTKGVFSGRINAYNALSMQSLPFIMPRGVRIEELSGNGDGIPQSYETVKLIISLENVWQNASSVNARLSKVSGVIDSVINDFSDYGYLNQGQIKDNTYNSFIVKLGNFSYEAPAEVALTINADGLPRTINLRLYFGVKGLVVDRAMVSRPAISNNWLVWSDTRNGYEDIYVYDLINNKEIAVTNDAARDVSPCIDGNTIVWVSNRDGYWSLYSYDLSTNLNTLEVSSPRLLRASKAKSANLEEEEILITSPSLSGNKVVWCESVYGIWDVYLLDIDQGEIYQLTSDSYREWDSTIVGEKITWLSQVDKSLFDLYLGEWDTQELTKVVTLNNPFFNFIPDTTFFQFKAMTDKKLAWYNMSPDQSNFDMYIYDIASKETKQITNDYALQMYPALYSNTLIYSQINTMQESMDLIAYDLSTNTSKPITIHPAHQMYPVVSENFIVFSDYRDGGMTFGPFGFPNGNLYIIRQPKKNKA